MNWIATVLKDFTPGAAGVWFVAAMVAIYMVREWRETRKLSSEDRQARREGYTRQVAMLQDENRNLMDDHRKLREEYDQYRRLCQNETDQLRDHIMTLEDRVSGFLRKIADIAVRASKGDIDADLSQAILQLSVEAQETQASRPAREGMRFRRFKL